MIRIQGLVDWQAKRRYRLDWFKVATYSAIIVGCVVFWVAIAKGAAYIFG